LPNQVALRETLTISENHQNFKVGTRLESTRGNDGSVGTPQPASIIGAAKTGKSATARSLVMELDHL
jgi:hypothetical protein